MLALDLPPGLLSPFLLDGRALQPRMTPMDPLARRKLGRTNVEVTQLGLGGAGLGDLFDVVEDADASATLQAAWDAGIRYYDTSPWYGRGQSEHRFGRALYRRPRSDYVPGSGRSPSTMQRISRRAFGGAA
jgi:predicted aldo/keto reductase-like oxidoreductase